MVRRKVTFKSNESNTEDLEYWRPKYRRECKNSSRPCPFIKCRHHLYLDVSPKGVIKFNHPNINELELNKMNDTCSLDVADRGGTTLEEVGQVMGFCRERTRQIEENALKNIRKLNVKWEVSESEKDKK